MQTRAGVESIRLRTGANKTERRKTGLSVELWSLASVAGFMINLGTEPGAELQDDEIAFLKSFAGLVERLCKDQYQRETEAVRS